MVEREPERVIWPTENPPHPNHEREWLRGARRCDESVSASNWSLRCRTVAAEKLWIVSVHVKHVQMRTMLHELPSKKHTSMFIT